MSYPPGPDDSGDAQDPWATPSSDQPTPAPPPQPGYAQQPPYGQKYGQQYGQQYGQPQYGQYNQPGPYGYGQPPRTNGKATAALWTGIGSLVLSLCCLGIVGVLPIVLGVKARSEIRATGGQQEGEGMALAGIITGAVAIVLSIAIMALVVLAIVSGDANFSTGTDTRV
jgi:hypothetical protein